MPARRRHVVININMHTNTPLSGLRAGLIPAGDPLLIFVLLLQASVPCAQNTVVLLTLQKKPEVKHAPFSLRFVLRRLTHVVLSSSVK